MHLTLSIPKLKAQNNDSSHYPNKAQNYTHSILALHLHVEQLHCSRPQIPNKHRKFVVAIIIPPRLLCTRKRRQHYQVFIVQDDQLHQQTKAALTNVTKGTYSRGKHSNYQHPHTQGEEDLPRSSVRQVACHSIQHSS